MFADGRSKKVVFIAHCLLNQNAISDGTAVFPAAFRDVIQTFLDAEIGIVQMPCPELCCLGLDRGDRCGACRPVTEENTRIRRAMGSDSASQILMRLADAMSYSRFWEYPQIGFEIVGIVGANRFPNCGVETTSENNRELPGKGIFMEELSRRLQSQQLSIPMLGLKASDHTAEKVQSLIK